MTKSLKNLLPKKLRHWLGCRSAQLTEWRRHLTEWRLHSFFPWEKVVIFDVGANTGHTYSSLLKWLPRAQVYAFEPTPELVIQLRGIETQNSNYHVIPKAVAEAAGVASFNVANLEAGHWGGCSSLLDFADGREKTWPGRHDLMVTRQIDVEVIRLDEFVRANKIERIDFLHIDVQGMDLSVLRSLGKEIKLVRAGVMEVPQSRAVMLYKNQHSREEAEEFLAQNGFEIYRVVSQPNEDNLYFRRR